MGYMTRHTGSQCQSEPAECSTLDTPFGARGFCGSCRDIDTGFVVNCNDCTSQWEYCSPCYKVKVEMPAITFISDAGCPSLSLASGTASMVEGEEGGLVCAKSLECGDGAFKCDWGAGCGGTNKPLICCDQAEYCDARDNVVYGADIGFVGSYAATSYIGCFGAGGCFYTDQITKIGVWLSIDCAGCADCGGINCRGRRTAVKIHLAPYLLEFDCYTNFAAGYGGAGDDWFMYGSTSCVEGCGCPPICEEITCETLDSDEWMIPSGHQARGCIPCTGPNVEAVYRATGSAMGDATVTLTHPVTPCDCDWHS